MKNLNNKTLLECGNLVYLPSKVTVFKLDDKDVITKQCSLDEPAIVPLIEVGMSSKTAKIYYKGESWWAHVSDFYHPYDSGNSRSQK